MTVDASLYQRINDFADSTMWAHGPVRAYAKYGIAILAILLLAAWWQARRRDDGPAAVATVAWAAGAALAALAVAQLINRIVDRSRPYNALPDAHVLIARSADASFPSDHSTAAAAAAVGLLVAGSALGSRRLGILAALAASLLAFSRVYVGVHYPGDVLAGVAIGGLVALVFAPLARRLLTSIARRAATTPLAWFISAASPSPPERTALR